MKVSELSPFLYKGIRVVHSNVPDTTKKPSVGRVERVLDGGLLEVRWDNGASIGEYPPTVLDIYDPY